MPDVTLGSANLVGGFPLEVIAGDDGTVELWEREACFGFILSSDGVNQLRELLDRAAMPGQAGHPQ